MWNPGRKFTAISIFKATPPSKRVRLKFVTLEIQVHSRVASHSELSSRTNSRRQINRSIGSKPRRYIVASPRSPRGDPFYTGRRGDDSCVHATRRAEIRILRAALCLFRYVPTDSPSVSLLGAVGGANGKHAVATSICRVTRRESQSITMNAISSCSISAPCLYQCTRWFLGARRPASLSISLQEP